MIERIFHPIGQGAFYTEQHKDFTIVYDCGNWKNSRKATGVVKQGLEKNSDVDILFISHFDFDHVSKIDVLKKHTNIKKVVLPVLQKSERTMLSNLYQLLGYSELAKLVKNPEEYFGNETVVIRVEPPVSDDENLDEIKPITIQDISNYKNIKSGTKITNICDKVDWVYIPYNFEQKSRKADLKKFFDGDKEKYKSIANILNENSDTQEILEIIEEDVSKTKKCKGKLLQDIYNHLKGKINQNSMLVYSGPLNNTDNYQKESYLNEGYLTKPIEYNDRVGCIYTGDSNLNDFNLKDKYEPVWDNVGTIQIPHHGDIKSFDISLLNNKSLICPMSFGENNSYGHPSNKLISTIILNKSLPVLVTENLSSGYIELINLNYSKSTLPNWVERSVDTDDIPKLYEYSYYLLDRIKNTTIKSHHNYYTRCRLKELKSCCDKKNIELCLIQV